MKHTPFSFSNGYLKTLLTRYLGRLPMEKIGDIHEILVFFSIQMIAAQVKLGHSISIIIIPAQAGI